MIVAESPHHALKSSGPAPLLDFPRRGRSEARDPPADQNRGDAQGGEAPLDQRAGWAGEGQGGETAENASHQQPEEMRPEVHPLPSRSQHREEREGSGDGRPGAAAAGAEPPAADQPRSAENAYRPEDGRGGSDRDMRVAASEGIEEIATGAGRENQGGAQALAEAAAHRGQEDRARDGVGERVGGIGVEGERGHAAPDLPEKDPPGIGAAPLEPDRLLAPGTGYQEKGQEHCGGGEPGARRA